MNYGFGITLRKPLETVVNDVTAALSQEGFGILSEIKVDEKLKEKLGEDIKPYYILGACNPPLAHQAINAEPNIGLLLPCNVLVRQLADDAVEVSFMDPVAVLGLIDNPDIIQIGQEVKARLLRVQAALEAG